MRSLTIRACRCLLSSLERVRFAALDFPGEKASSMYPNEMFSLVSKFNRLSGSSPITRKMSFASTAEGTAISQTRVTPHTQASLEYSRFKSYSRDDWRQIRGICSTATLWKSPLEAGGKAKPYSSLKRRFKLTGSGTMRCMSPGFVHKRFNKSKRRLLRLSKGILLPPTFEKAMKKLGFVSRKY
eukprot:jgi/Picsp_1/2639/NSC_00869-R1_structural constituent of ribosome